MRTRRQTSLILNIFFSCLRRFCMKNLATNFALNFTSVRIGDRRLPRVLSRARAVCLFLSCVSLTDAQFQVSEN